MNDRRLPISYTRTDISHLREEHGIGRERTVELVKTACLTAKKRKTKDGSYVVLVGSAISETFLLANEFYPTLVLLLDYVAEALDVPEKKVRSSLTSARKTLAIKGRALYNFYGVGYKVANDEEEIIDIARACLRKKWAALGHLSRLSVIASNNYNVAPEYLELYEICARSSNSSRSLLDEFAEDIAEASDAARDLFNAIEHTMSGIDTDRIIADISDIAESVEGSHSTNLP